MRADSSGCLFLRFPPQLFGERILQLLTWHDLRKLNISITNTGLRKEWWLADKKKSTINDPRALNYTINDEQGLTVRRGKWELTLMKRMGLRTSKWQLDFDISDLDTSTVRKLMDYCGDIITSLEIANISTI